MLKNLWKDNALLSLVLVLLGFIFSEPSFKNQGFQVLSKFAGRLSSMRSQIAVYGG